MQGEYQKPSVIVAAAQRDVGSLLDGAAQLALVDGCLPAGQLAETTVAIRQRLARAVDDVRRAEVPVRGELSAKRPGHVQVPGAFCLVPGVRCPVSPAPGRCARLSAPAV